MSARVVSIAEMTSASPAGCAVVTVNSTVELPRSAIAFPLADCTFESCANAAAAAAATPSRFTVMNPGSLVPGTRRTCAFRTGTCAMSQTSPSINSNAPAPASSHGHHVDEVTRSAGPVLICSGAACTTCVGHSAAAAPTHATTTPATRVAARSTRSVGSRLMQPRSYRCERRFSVWEQGFRSRYPPRRRWSPSPRRRIPYR